MKVLVTGAGGFLAEQICLKVAEAGHHVMAMHRSDYNKDFDSIENITPVKANLLDKNSLIEAVKGCDQIYHVAAFSNNWAKDPSIFYKVNIGGSVKLLEAAKEAGVKKIVITSSAGTIGPAGDNDYVTEDQYRIINFFGDYESSKFILDERVQHYVRKGMDISIVCPARIFGPGKYGVKGNIISKIVTGYIKGNWKIKLGNGQDKACYAFIEDVVQGHLLTMEKGQPGEKYLIGSFNDTFQGFLDTVGEMTGKKRNLIPIPFWLLSFYAKLIGGIANLFKFDPVVTKEWMIKLQCNWQADLSKAKKELGFNPHTKEEALQKTIDWIKKDIL